MHIHSHIYIHTHVPFNIGATASQASLVISHSSVRGLSLAIIVEADLAEVEEDLAALIRGAVKACTLISVLISVTRATAMDIPCIIYVLMCGNDVYDRKRISDGN